MANNKWIYANLTEDEKINKISNGNPEIYRIESEQNKALKKQYEDAGVDTSGVDAWQARLDTARAEAVANIPNYKTYSVDAIAIQDLHNARKIADEALKNALSVSKAVDESYVNRGLKLDGYDYKQYRQQLKNSLVDEIERLYNSFGPQYLKKLGNSFYGDYKRKIDEMFR